MAAGYRERGKIISDTNSSDRLKSRQQNIEQEMVAVCGLLLPSRAYDDESRYQLQVRMRKRDCERVRLIERNGLRDHQHISCFEGPTDEA